MIRRVQVNNFKSIPDLALAFGRVTVLIGANGSGKSNILEAIAMASAAAQDKLDNEFLITRGIRVTDKRFMLSAFRDLRTLPEFVDAKRQDGSRVIEEVVPKHEERIKISILGNNEHETEFELFTEETASYSKWKEVIPKQFLDVINKVEVNIPPLEKQRLRDVMENVAKEVLDKARAPRTPTLTGFLIYSPENAVLRTFQTEGQILPLGRNGEGLFAHLKALNSEKNKARLEAIKETLTLIDWFETFEIPNDLSPGERSIRIHDRFLPDSALFDQRSANEGFLFLLFYITLFISPDTPAFFAIDNIDSSLNPKLCLALMQQIVKLAKKYDKQVILTTHNPAVLDGLDLNDDEQRLLVVDRNKDGHTRVRRVEPPKIVAGQIPVSVSEAFVRGYIGGLPNNF